MSKAKSSCTLPGRLAVKAYDYDCITNQVASIRILRIHPSSHSDAELYCTLETVDLREKPQYTALSYTWGEHFSHRVISLQGHQFRVTENLFNILKWLRHPIEFRRIWVDAICINQADDEERTHEVSLMKQIYAGAEEVLIWLCDSDESLESALGTIAQHMPDPLSSYGILTDTVKSIRRVLASSWWTRMWTVQEMAVARQHPVMTCGKTRLSLDAFYNISSTVEAILRESSGKSLANESDPLFALHNASIRAAWRTYYGGTEIRYDNEALINHQNKLWLADLLVATSTRQATDPRDHIFALIGLVPTLAKSLKPDYQQSTRDVYQRAMLEILKLESTRDLLQFAVYAERTFLPSWCIDFSVCNWNAPPENLPRLVELGRREALVQTVSTSSIQHDLFSGSVTLPGSTYGSIAIVVGPLNKQGLVAAFISGLRNDRDEHSPLLDMLRMVVTARRSLKPLAACVISSIAEMFDLALGTDEFSALTVVELKKMWRLELNELDSVPDRVWRRDRWKILRRRLRVDDHGEIIREWLEEGSSGNQRMRHRKKSDEAAQVRPKRLRQKAPEHMPKYKFNLVASCVVSPEDMGFSEIDNKLVNVLNRVMNLLFQAMEAAMETEKEEDGWLIIPCRTSSRVQGIDDSLAYHVNRIMESLMQATEEEQRKKGEEIGLFATENGTLGRVKGQFLNGDVICAFAGCRNPAVLRQMDDGRYRLVNFALVPGVSTGTREVSVLNGLQQPIERHVTLC